MRVQGYSVELTRLSQENGGGYAAIVHDLPGCISDGSTPSEALRNADDAITCWLEGAAELGREIPKPSEHRAFA